MPPDLALWSTLISSNYPGLEHIFMVQMEFEPLKFYSSNYFHYFLEYTVKYVTAHNMKMLVHQPKCQY